MKLNVQLAEKVLNTIHAHPEGHYQGTWLDSECGTTACIAGHAMLASGEYVRVQDENGTWRFAHRVTGREPTPEMTGAQLLGLDPNTANDLFMEMNESRAIQKLQDLIDEARHDQHHTPTIQGEKS